ncbi:TonB-dependent receptor [Burkholderiaceae bacterium UC74_6]
MRRSTRPHHGNAPQKRHKLAALLVPCMGALFAPSIWAQEATPAAADGTSADSSTPTTQKLERVTVSATRRREPVREVPLRVESLDAESLERAGATSLSDTIGALPGVDVKADSGPGRSAVTMRGVSLGEQTIATVGVYVDDVPFGSSSAFVAGGSMALDMGLLDLHHVELLRGPQGTLYGAGAMGGLLKYVTNEPDSSQFSGKVGVGVRSTQDGGMGHTENLVLNMPLSKDVAALRVAAFNDHDGGYVKAIGTAAGDHINDGNTRGVRASALIEPMTKMKIRLSSAQQEIQRNGLNAIDYDVSTGKPMNGDLVRALSVREPYKIKTRLSSADVEYDFGFARLNAVVATQGLDGNTSQDATPFLGGSPAFDYAVLDNAIKLRKQTQELRLTSQRGTVEWLLGYYRDREIGRVDQRLWAKLAGAGIWIYRATASRPSTASRRSMVT